MIVQQVMLDSSAIDAGALLGTTGRQELINSINARCGGSSFFGSEQNPYRDQYFSFMSKIVAPLRQAKEKLLVASNLLYKVDSYRAIDSLAELEKGIPPCMHMGIITYPPIRQMLEEERIDGFGIKPEHLPDEDVYGRLINNGRVELYDGFSTTGEFTTVEKICSLDPEMTPEELDALEVTRQFIDQFISDEDTRYMDFTDYPSLHA